MASVCPVPQPFVACAPRWHRCAVVRNWPARHNVLTESPVDDAVGVRRLRQAWCVTPDRLPTVFTRSEALAAGVSAGELRGPRFRKVFHNVHARAEVAHETRVRALAALAIGPDAALVARQTAAELMGGVVPPDARVHLALPHGRLRARGIRAVRRRVTSAARIAGVRVTTAEDTFVDLTAELSLVDLVVLGDSLVSRGRATPESLMAASSSAVGPLGELARRAAGLVRGGVDSPMESRLRMLLVLAGLPEPVVNHIEFREDGRWVRRYDLSFPSHRLAIEYDGRQHAESQRQWERDVERREELDNDGWRIVVVLAKGIYREPGRTLDRVVAAMRAAGVPGSMRSDEWRLYFPGR